MKNKRIKSISLGAFRGATKVSELTFDTTKPIVLLFGENGTGKSTLVDAIDFLCNGSIGSISEKSSTSISNLATAGKNPKDVTLSLEYDGETSTGSISNKKVVVSQARRPPVYVLRRSRVISILDDSPKDRYQNFAKYLDVAKVEKAEASLRAAALQVENELNTTTIRYSESLDNLTAFWNAEGSPGSSPLEWAKQKTQAPLIQIKNSIDQGLNFEQSVAKLKFHRDQLTDSETGAAQATERLAEVEKAGPTSGESDGDAQLVSLLRAALDHISAGKCDNCPVCRQAVDSQALKNDISERIAAHSEVERHAQEMRRVSQRKLESENRVASDWSAFLSALSTCVQKLNSMPLEIAGCKLDELAADGGTREQAEAAYRHLSEISVLTSKKIESLRRDLNQLTAITSHLEGCHQTQGSLKETSALKEVMAEVVKQVKAERLEFTEQVLSEICAEVNLLYSRIHPNENLGLRRFKMDPKHQGSLLQEAYFETVEDVAPQALFSESHLDTLGFCMLLATVKWSKAPDAILVLDDVFSSVDSSHLRRIIDLLTEQSEHFSQVIIATHYRPWMEHYRFSAGAANSVHVIELHNWSFEHGIRARTSTLALEELRVSITPMNWDRQAVASKAGILLEHALDHLTFLYSCSLPRSSENYTLGSLLDGFKKSSKEIVIYHPPAEGGMAGAEAVAVKDIVAQVSELTFIRNRVGCHFNLQGFIISDDDVRLFGELTLKLLEAFLCRQCGSLPLPNRKGTDGWHCSCKKTKTTPLGKH